MIISPQGAWIRGHLVVSVSHRRERSRAWGRPRLPFPHADATRRAEFVDS